MYKSKLIQLLAAFSSEEASDLKQFILSPLFIESKRPQKVQALLQYLLPHHPTFESEELEAGNVYQALFPGEAYNKNKLNKLNSEAVKVIQKFIVIHEANTQDEVSDWMTLAKFFQAKELTTHFQYAVGKAQRLLEKSKHRERAYFHKQFLLEIEQAKYLLKLNDKKGDVNLPAAIRHLDQYYILSKMEHCFYLLTRAASTKLEVSKSMILLEEVLQAAKAHFLEVPAVAAYYYTFALLPGNGQEEEGSLEILEEVLEQYDGLISEAALKTFHNFIRNYLANRYNQGDAKSLVKLFTTFQEQMEKGTIYQDGKHIWASTLQNAITVALKLEEYEWAMQFLLEHQTRIKGADDSEDIFRFNLANIYFHQGKFQEAQECLDTFHFREMFYNLAVRRLDIKLNYEIQLSLDLFESRLKALKIFIYDQKRLLPKDKYDSNNNFVKLMFQIFTILKEDEERKFLNVGPHPKREHKILTLQNKLSETSNISEREWLNEKLELLSKVK